VTIEEAASPAGNARRPPVPKALHHLAGSLAKGPWAVSLMQPEAGWSWVSLRALVLEPGQSASFGTGNQEVLVLPLAGSCKVTCDGEEHDLHGRPNVFAGVTDFAYVPCAATVTVASALGGRFAVPGAMAQQRLPFRYRAAPQTPVELRGAGNCSRRVVNYCMATTFEADHLIVCEVITPGGNWSSYPPHKHDEERPGEARLEEIYYFEVGKGPSGEPGFAYQRIYGTPGRPIDLLVEVHDRDLVLVPHGYHGPSMAAPGYDLYYLNAMAGPGARAWLVSDDPAHAWVRESWERQHIDPRLTEPGARDLGGEM